VFPFQPALVGSVTSRVAEAKRGRNARRNEQTKESMVVAGGESEGGEGSFLQDDEISY